MFTRETAIDKVKAFLIDCQQLPVQIERAILFGSVVKGKANEDSDIDLALFSPNFGDNILANLDMIGKINIRYPEIDVHTFHSTHSDGTGILLYQILNDGVEVSVA